MSLPYSVLGAGALAIAAFLPLPAVAEQPTQDPEEEVDEGLRNSATSPVWRVVA